MYKCEREDEIMALLSETEYATVEALAQRINISASSIRRDLKNLESRGLVERSYGGVRLVNSAGRCIPFEQRAHQNCGQKKQMGRIAAGLLHPGDTVFLDASSSAYFAAEFLPAVEGITVITNSIDAAAVLSAYSIKVYCTGGALSEGNRAALVGDSTREFLSRIHADAVIFSVDGVDPGGELWDYAEEESAVRRMMMQNAKTKILLCDSSKWGKPSTFYQGRMEDVSYLICDRDPNRFFSDPTPEKYLFH